MEHSELLLNAPLPERAQGGRLSHAYIVAGDSTGALAMTLAAAAVCSGAEERPCRVCRDCVKAARGVHPDIIIADSPEPGREIVVDRARAIRRDASIVPNEAERKAYIIRNADMLNTAAQNAMLKLLEEPPANAVFILDVADPSSLLATVRSRCTELRGATDTGSSQDTSGAELAEAFIAALEQGAAELCAFSFKLDRLDRPGLTVFLDEAEARLIGLMKAAAHTGAPGYSVLKLSRAVSAITRARDYARQNVSAGHLSGMLCAELI